MPSQYQRAIPLADRRDANAQRIRYDNLSAFIYKISEHNHNHPYPQAGIRRLLESGRILTKEGEVRQKRLERLLKSLSIKANITANSSEWERVLEGIS
jgi:hypothetical protein